MTATWQTQLACSRSFRHEMPDELHKRKKVIHGWCLRLRSSTDSTNIVPALGMTESVYVSAPDALRKRPRKPTSVAQGNAIFSFLHCSFYNSLSYLNWCLQEMLHTGLHIENAISFLAIAFLLVSMSHACFYSCSADCLRGSFTKHRLHSILK